MAFGHSFFFSFFIFFFVLFLFSANLFSGCTSFRFFDRISCEMDDTPLSEYHGRRTKLY